MKTDKHFIYSLITIILVAFVFMILTGYFMNEADALNNKLTYSQKELALAQADISTMQESYETETAKVNKLKTELETANEIIEALKSEEYVIGMTVTEREINMIAQTVWGEARGCNTLEQSAVVWCILNRVDAGHGTIAEVVTAPRQFHGYSSSFPVTDEIKALVIDVIARWKLEKICYGDVGRTLPINYLYFSADGTGIGNIFRDAYSGSYNVWNWDCWSPYS